MKKKARSKPIFTGKVAILLLLAIIAFGLLISFLTYAGPSPFYDDSNYLALSHQIIELNPAFIGSIFGFDYLQLMPLAVSQYLLGYGDFQVILPSIIEYVVMIIFAFLIGRQISGYSLGLLSAFFTATAPFVTVNVTRVLPDMATGMAVAISLYLFVLCAKSKQKFYIQMLYGASTVFPFFMKVEGLSFFGFSWLAIIMAAAYYRFSGSFTTKRFLVFAAIGAAVAMFIYFMVFALLINDPFFGLQNQRIAPVQPPLENAIIAFNPNTFSFASPSETEAYPIGLLVYFAIAGSILATTRRNKYMSFISIVGWGVLAYLLAGTTSYQKYVPITTHTRFFAIILIPLSVLAAYAVISLYEQLAKSRRIFGLAAVGLLIFLLFFSYYQIYAIFANANAALAPDFSPFYSAANYIENLQNLNNTAVFVYAPSGFYSFALQDFNFAAKYNPHYSTYGVNNTVYKATHVCNLDNVSGSAYLLNVDPLNYTNFKNVSRTYLNTWEGANCTQQYLTHFNNGSTYIAVYRLASLKV